MVSSGQTDGDRLPRGPRGDVDAHELLALRAQVLAEGRVALLALAQLVLGEEGEIPEVVGGTDAGRLGERPAIQRGAARGVASLACRLRRLAWAGRYLPIRVDVAGASYAHGACAISSPATTSAARPAPSP